MNDINVLVIKKLRTNLFNEKIIDKYNDLEIRGIEKYASDKENFNFSSLCVVKIENGDLIIAYKGEEYYYHHLYYALGNIYNFLEKKGYSHKIFAYCLDNETFACVPKKGVTTDEFIDITRKLSTHCQFIKPNNSSIPLLLRFSVVTNQENPLAAALLQIDSCESEQDTYLFSDTSLSLQDDKLHEMQVISNLSWAIKNNGIIPYYQGIYDNETGLIEKYEALMRIKGQDGTIYSPYYFMDIAKKYHLYNTINSIMLSKVIEDVDKYNLVASANISAFDINSEQFRENIYRMLSQRKSNKMFVVELLEDEAFQDIDTLKDFIKTVSAFNVKIAIDDFGSGFSNLFQIGEINPGFIKIDGKIIKNIVGSKVNQAIILAVKMLAIQFGAHIVAEYVENEEIQNCIKDLGVTYSQGYYFAKPLPLEEILPLREKVGDKNR